MHILRAAALKLNGLCKHEARLKMRLADEDELLVQSRSMYHAVRSLGAPTVVPLSVAGAPPLVAMPQGYAALLPPQIGTALVAHSSTVLAMVEQQVLNTTAELAAIERLLLEAAREHTALHNHVWLNRKRDY